MKGNLSITGFGQAPAYLEFYIVCRYAAQEVNPHHTHTFLISHQNRNHPCKSKPTKRRSWLIDGGWRTSSQDRNDKTMLTPRSRRTIDLLLHANYAKSSRSRDRDLIKHSTPKIPKLTRKFSEDDMNVFPSSTRLWYVVKFCVILVNGAWQHSDAPHVAQVRQPLVYFADMVWRTDCNTMSACRDVLELGGICLHQQSLQRRWPKERGDLGSGGNGPGRHSKEGVWEGLQPFLRVYDPLALRRPLAPAHTWWGRSGVWRNGPGCAAPRGGTAMLRDLEWRRRTPAGTIPVDPQMRWCTHRARGRYQSRRWRQLDSRSPGDVPSTPG